MLSLYEISHFDTLIIMKFNNLLVLYNEYETYRYYKNSGEK